LGGLDALPDSGGLALDDADSVAAEPLLLHLLNTARDRALKVLLAGRLPTSRWPVRLPDLSSRLRAIAAVEIGAPDDDLLAALLIRLLADRQLRVTRAVQTRLLTRLPRSAEAMRHAVARLDRASLTLGKPVGIALADQIISELSGTRDATLDGYEHSKSAATPSSQTPGFL
jgi:chromosomal replication initiation ATPase DnaA